MKQTLMVFFTGLSIMSKHSGADIFVTFPVSLKPTIRLWITDGWPISIALALILLLLRPTLAPPTAERGEWHGRSI